MIARVAVSAARYAYDKPYDYLIPDSLTNIVKPGSRVIVPFSGGKSGCEGIVLSLSESSDQDSLKTIISVCENEPFVSEEQLRLAFFIRERYFCTIFEAIRCIFPSGIWSKASKQARMSGDDRLSISAELSAEAVSAFIRENSKKSPARVKILSCLLEQGPVSRNELLKLTGVSDSTLLSSIRDGFVTAQSAKTSEYFSASYGYGKLPVLNETQNEAFQKLSKICDKGEPNVSLLYGVTGSGKTAVYLHLINKQIEMNKGTILLVPEIALTPQTVSVLTSVWKDKVAVIHSGLTPGERSSQWNRIASGEAMIVIGTRSAIFAPVRNLGLIIIDEEQDDSYRSEASPRYKAKDIAKFRCMQASCPVVFGSATPDITSMYNAKKGVYNMVALSGRYNMQELPAVEIVDMRRELRNGVSECLSRKLIEELDKNIENDEQSIVFINRRGAHKIVSCVSCSYTYRCPNCSVSLTYHSANNILKCHYCGYNRHADENCPECGGELKYSGAGTQKVESELRTIFPETGILRYDADIVSKESHSSIIERFINDRVPILVGTQMVSKGLNFDNVTLAAVVSADQSLYGSSYRAGEDTFSLITQVVGRSGRAEKKGRAIIQTFSPFNETVLYASRQDYDAFYESEIQLRAMQKAPPFSTIFAVSAVGTDESKLLKLCSEIRSILVKHYTGENSISVLGPVSYPVLKINNKYRYRIFIFCPPKQNIRKTVSHVLQRFSDDSRFSGITLFAEENPRD